jgi:heterodisulfide reductase subunit C2
MADRFIWLCTGCQTCSTRCPQEIDVAGIMDELRMLAYEHDLVRKDAPFASILRYNADSFKRWGRMYELELLARDKIMRPSSMTDDLMLGVKMVMKGKIGFVPSRGGDRAQMKRMVEAADRVEKRRRAGSASTAGAGSGGAS